MASWVVLSITMAAKRRGGWKMARSFGQRRSDRRVMYAGGGMN
jgi:hypothetical protein